MCFGLASEHCRNQFLYIISQEEANPLTLKRTGLGFEARGFFLQDLAERV